MTTLARFLSQRINALGWNRMTLAHEWHKCLGSESATILDATLLRLINGDDDGRTFLLSGDGSRLAALALALKCRPEEIRERADNAGRTHTLILDPRLRERVRASFHTRAANSGGTLLVREIDGAIDDSRRREALRDLARSQHNPIVVVSDDADTAFFEGAGLATSPMSRSRPGCQLLRFPELIPPAPLQLRHADGTPMVPAPNHEARYRTLMAKQASPVHSDQPREYELRTAQQWVERIEEADDLDSPVTFRLDWLGRSPTAEDLTRLVRARVAAVMSARNSDPCRERPAEEPPRYVWVHGGRIRAICPADDPTRALVEGFHAIHEVGSVDLLVQRLSTVCTGLNPYRKDGNVDFDLSDALRAVRDETGLELTLDGRWLREVVGRYARPDDSSWPSERRAVVRASPERDHEVRAAIDELLLREFSLVEASAAVVLKLLAVRDAELVHVHATGTSCTAVANVGAGRMLYLRITRYAGERSSAVTAEAAHLRTVFDGANIRLELRSDFDPDLEGTVLRSVRRRREEDEAHRDDSYD